MGTALPMPLVVLALICFATIAYSVRPADFKKCADSSFCRRIRRLSSYAEGQSSSKDPFKSPYYIASGSSSFDTSDSSLTASIKSALHPEVDFELKAHFYEDGTSRIMMDQTGHRFGGWKRYDGAASWAIDQQPIPAASGSVRVEQTQHETVVR